MPASARVARSLCLARARLTATRDDGEHLGPPLAYSATSGRRWYRARRIADRSARVDSGAHRERFDRANSRRVGDTGIAESTRRSLGDRRFWYGLFVSVVSPE